MDIVIFNIPVPIAVIPLLFVILLMLLCFDKRWNRSLSKISQDGSTDSSAENSQNVNSFISLTFEDLEEKEDLCQQRNTLKGQSIAIDKVNESMFMQKDICYIYIPKDSKEFVIIPTKRNVEEVFSYIK